MWSDCVERASGHSQTDRTPFFGDTTFKGTSTVPATAAPCEPPIEGARFVYDKKSLQKHTDVTIWESMYGGGGRAIYEPHEQMTAMIEATIDTLINEFAES